MYQSLKSSRHNEQKGMNTMKIGYARVSTVGQDLAAQVELLKEYGVSEQDIYKEKVTGTSTAQRTELDSLLRHVRAGDEVIVSKIDRLARSITDLNKIVELLADKGVSIRFITDNLTFEADSNSAMNTLIFNMLGSFAQFERDLIVQRTTEGRERAKAQGKHMGRPKQPRANIERAVQLFNSRKDNGLSVKDIVNTTGVPRATIYHEAKLSANQ